MTTAFQTDAFQNNAFQAYDEAFQRCAFQYGAFQTDHCPTPTPPTPSPSRHEPGGPGGSNKAGKKWRKRKINTQRPGGIIAWGKVADLLDALPEETHQQDVFTDVVLDYISDIDVDISSINALLSAIDSAITRTTKATRSREIQLEAYKQAVVENHRKIKRKREEDFVVALMGVV